jgi:hypothetical protein
VNRAICRSLLALASAAVAAAGCGDPGPKLVPVAGVVLIDGKPLTHGFVQVAPVGGRAATGKIGPDGRFTLTTFTENDGCYVGTHPVAVVATESIDGSSQRWHAPKKYTSADTSGLTVTVDGPTDGLKIELTWDGGKPFVQHFSKE